MNRILGPQSGKTFSKPPNLMAIPVKGLVSTKANHRSQVTSWATEEGQNPQGPPVRKKPPKEYSTPPQARGLLSGTNTRVPKEDGLMVINFNSSEQSRARLQLQLTPMCASSTTPGLWGQAPPHPTPRPRAPPRLTSKGWLYLARHLEIGSATPDV